MREAISWSCSRCNYLYSETAPCKCGKLGPPMTNPTDTRPDLVERLDQKADALFNAEGVDAQRLARDIREAAATIERLTEALEQGEESLDQLLDDMGETGQSVCLAAKDEAVEALTAIRTALDKQEGA